MNRDSTGDKLINFPPGYRLSASPYLAINRELYFISFLWFLPNVSFPVPGSKPDYTSQGVVKCPMAPPGRHSFQGFFSITLTGLRSCSAVFVQYVSTGSFLGVFLATRLGVCVSGGRPQRHSPSSSVSPRVRTFLTEWPAVGRGWASAFSAWGPACSPHALLWGRGRCAHPPQW